MTTVTATTTNPADSASLCHEIGTLLLARAQWLATAESCTGGLIAKRLTDVAGSSRWFECGLVSYSNRAKQDLLRVPATLLEAHGAVSEEVARALAEGLMLTTPAHWGVAVTGIAGPGGGSKDKPVGTVWVAWIERGHDAQAERLQLHGSREAIREASALAALQGLARRLRVAA